MTEVGADRGQAPAHAAASDTTAPGARARACAWGMRPSGSARLQRGGPAPLSKLSRWWARLPYHAYRAGEAVAGAFPHGLVNGTAAMVGSMALRVAPHRFDGLRANLRRAVPDVDDAELERIVHANVRNLARCWADVLEMRHRADTLAAGVTPVNVENMTGPLGRGRGVVIVSLHLGRWEVGLAGWNHRFGRMSLLAEVVHPPELFEHIVASRTSMGVTVIPIDTAAMRERADTAVARRRGAAALREVFRTLKGNGMVAMAMDRDLIGNGTPLEFFGADAPIPVGVVDVAIRSGAAIVPVILLRAGDRVIAPCYPEITYDPEADRDTEIRRVAAAVLRIFEQVIREHPDQWHVIDPIWPDLAATSDTRRAA
jgi:lauroyl/myristoyl acyltransferase